MVLDCSLCVLLPVYCCSIQHSPLAQVLAGKSSALTWQHRWRSHESQVSIRSVGRRRRVAVLFPCTLRCPLCLARKLVFFSRRQQRLTTSSPPLTKCSFGVTVSKTRALNHAPTLPPGVHIVPATISTVRQSPFSHRPRCFDRRGLLAPAVISHLFLAHRTHLPRHNIQSACPTPLRAVAAPPLLPGILEAARSAGGGAPPPSTQKLAALPWRGYPRAGRPLATVDALSPRFIGQAKISTVEDAVDFGVDERRLPG